MKLMGEKIKNRQSLWLGTILFLIFLGLAFPLQFARAAIISGILGVLTSIPVAIITVLLQVILLVTNLFVSIAGVILWWVLSPYFMSLPYTHGGIVDVGWPIVRDFINMFFIIALVIIGLATALRIKEYQAQKALPLLIIIAILINFTPVICGLIVDASNIVMNFFLEELTGLRVMITVFSQQGALLVEMFSHPFDIRYASTALGKTLGLIAFGGIAGFVFLLYSLLFIMRYVMIWVLVIVSPIAFFSRIFPGSEKYLFKSILGWDEWWKQFIEWSLLGVVAGFFLYLGEQLMVLAPNFIPGIYPEGVGGMLATPIIDFMNNLLPYGVVLAFLLLGFMVATSTSALGAVGITRLAKKGATAMRREVAKIGWEGVQKGWEGVQKGAGLTWKGTKTGVGAVWKGIRYPKETVAGIARYAKKAPGEIKGAGEAMRTREFWKETVPAKIKTGTKAAGRGLRTAWEEVGEPIFEKGWEPFRKEYLGPKPGEMPEFEMPERKPGETDEEYTERAKEAHRSWEESMSRRTEGRKKKKGKTGAPTPPPTPVEEIYPVEMLERQVKEHLEQVRKAGGIPSFHPPFLTAYLRQKGISKEEISKMTPQDAWAKAEKILSGTPPPTPPPTPGRTEAPTPPPTQEEEKKKKGKGPTPTKPVPPGWTLGPGGIAIPPKPGPRITPTPRRPF